MKTLDNITHGTRAYMQDGKVNFKPIKEMECSPCSKMTKQAKTPIKRTGKKPMFDGESDFSETDRLDDCNTIVGGGGGGGSSACMT